MPEQLQQHELKTASKPKLLEHIEAIENLNASMGKSLKVSQEQVLTTQDKLTKCNQFSEKSHAMMSALRLAVCGFAIAQYDELHDLADGCTKPVSYLEGRYVPADELGYVSGVSSVDETEAEKEARVVTRFLRHLVNMTRRTF